MSDDLELSPCPFCGEDAHFMTYMSCATTKHGITCINADCPVRPTMYRFVGSREDAATAWNTRMAVQS